MMTTQQRRLHSGSGTRKGKKVEQKDITEGNA